MIIHKGILHPSGVSDKLSFRSGQITPIADFVNVIPAPNPVSRGGDQQGIWY